MPSASELRQMAEQPLDPSVPQTYELRGRQKEEQPAHDNRPAEATNAPTNEDYEPYSVNSTKLEPERQHILDSIIRLYSGSGKNDDAATGDQDIRVYAKKSVYDDIASYCDTRYKVAGQWWGIPAAMKPTTTTAVEVVSFTPIPERTPEKPGAIVFRMKRAWTPRLSPKTFDVNHFVTLTLARAVEEDGPGPSERVKYHKDQWNQKDYDHGGG